MSHFCVERGHGADRIGDQVLVEDVGDLVDGQGPRVALLGHRVHLQLEAHAQELDQGLVGDAIRVHPVEGGHRVGQGPDHPKRVAMGDDDSGVGVGGEHERQCRQM